jgi:hypothetical protein
MAADVSAEWLRLVTGSHEIATEIRVMSAGGDDLLTLTTITDGRLTEDCTRDVLRDAVLTAVDPTGELDPVSAFDLLAPVGNEINIRSGLIIDGVPELVQMGVFGISNPQTRVDSGGTVLTVSCYDRARRIQKAVFTDAYAVTAGADLADVIDTVLLTQWSLCPMLDSAVTETVTASVVWQPGDDPWAACRALAAAYGAELYFSEFGVPTMRYLPDPANGAVVATYGSRQTGRGATILDVDRGLNDEGTFSGVLVIVQSTDAPAPLRSLLWDEDPTSPTYHLGQFGERAFPISTSSITTQDQADTYAATQLPLVTGVLQSAAWEQIADPRLRTRDLVDNTDPLTGLEGIYSLEAIQTGLHPSGSQAATVKERRLRR